MDEQDTTISSTTQVSSTRFASGTKGVRIHFSTDTLTGSFNAPSGSVPSVTSLSSGDPGYSSGGYYQPGIEAARFFPLDSTSGSVQKPSWLKRVEVGITGTTAINLCAGFGGSGTRDASGFYRVSERECASVLGTGSSLDSVFVRVVLDRTPTAIGTAENLMMVLEYQASGLRPNSDSTGATTTGTDAEKIEQSLDQLWKTYIGSSLSHTATLSPFSIFVPPVYSSCTSTGTGAAAGASVCGDSQYQGSPTVSRQVFIPLSSDPSMSVIQISRIRGRVNNSGGTTYVGNFCGTRDQPLCLGVVFRSLTLLRI